MEKPQKKNPPLEEIIALFDETFSNHIERLLGEKNGFEALPMNLYTISCLIFLATRETEIESFPYLPPERYTEEKLFLELTEICIASGKNLKVQIQELNEKGYIDVADDGRFFAKKPTQSMSQLIDRIFPNMPGLNFVAYLGQMMDEVQMGRKGVEAAVDQFNQMLTLQGTPLKKAEILSAEKKDIDPQHIQTQKMGSFQKDGALLNHKRLSPLSKPKTLTSQLNIRMHTLRSIKPQETPFEDHKTRGTATDCQEDITVQDHEVPDEIIDKNEAERAEVKDFNDSGIDPAEIISRQSMENTGQQSHPSSSVKAQESDAKAEAIKDEQGSFDNRTQLDDDHIEKKIAAFEQELGMKCPICRIGGIKSEKTTKGKTYYHCSQSECNFISWGKPFYLTCPQCDNPFLVEIFDRMGKTVLKCPRATCRYWQRFPWDEITEQPDTSKSPMKRKGIIRKPRKRVRRVVRRKR